MIDVAIAEDMLPTVTAPAYATDQCTSTGTAYSFTVVGTGIAPLAYSVGAGFQSSPTITVSAPGTYTVTVRTPTAVPPPTPSTYCRRSGSRHRRRYSPAVP